MAFRILEQAKKQEEEQKKFKVLEPAKDVSNARQTVRGLEQGGLDLATAGLGLPLYPIEKGMQAFLHSQAEQMGLPKNPINERVPEAEGVLGAQQEQKFGQQHDVLGRIQQGQMPTMQELQELSDEYVSPGGATMLGSIGAIQNEIPEGGLQQELVRRATRTAPLFALNPALGAQAVLAEGAGLGAKETLKMIGASEGAQNWGDLIAGLLTGFLKPNTALEIERKASQVPKTLEQQALSLSDDILKDSKNRISAISKEALSDFGNFSSRETENLIAKGNRAVILDDVAKVDKLPQQAWKDVQEAATAQYMAERKVFEPLYKGVRTAAEKIEVNPVNSINMARQLFDKLTSLKTSPTGYGQTASLVKDVIQDLTGISPTIETIQNAIQSGNKQAIEAIYNSMISGNHKLKSDKLMDLSIRLNDAINYETLSPSVKDWLRPLQRTVKEEFKSSLKNSRPAVLQAYEKAEESYKATAKKFGKDVISKLRQSEVPENLGADFLNPSNLENLINVFGKQSAHVQDVDRQLVEQIGRMNHKQATETLKNLSPHLSDKAKNAAQKFIDLGDNLTSKGQTRLLEQNMLGDVSASITKGERPDFTLKAMRTPEGYSIAKKTFGRTDQGKKLFKVLEKQVVEDMFNSIVSKDGSIDWSKAKDILSDPGYETVMSEIMGVDGVQFIRNIEQWSDGIIKSLAASKIKEPGIFNKFYNTLSTPSKLALGAVLGPQLSLLLGTGMAVSGLALKQFGASIFTSEKMRRILRSFRSPLDPATAIKNANSINEMIDEN
jgi:hypothetical protein